MKHHVVARAPADVISRLREDPALRTLYRAKTLAEIDAVWGTLGAAQKDALLRAMAKVIWLQLRQISR